MKVILAVSLILFLIVGCNKKQEIVTLDSGLKYVNDTLGTGREAKTGDLVTIHFKVWTIKDSSDYFTDWSKDTTKFSQRLASSRENGSPFKYVLGSGGFVKGADDAIAGMKIGGTRTIIIPSDFAYGAEGTAGVPPNTNLKVVVELLDAKDAIHATKWEIDSSKIKTTKSGLKYYVIEQGSGPKPDSGSVVTVDYTGWLNDKKFDSSVERGEPIVFTLGVRQVPPGWDEGIMLLNKGTKAVLIIPPDLAYGPRQVGPIPPNSTLTFDVELLDIK